MGRSLAELGFFVRSNLPQGRLEPEDWSPLRAAGSNLLDADPSDYASGTVGLVRLMASSSAVSQFLPALLAGFVATHPGLRIELAGTWVERKLLIGMRDAAALARPARLLLDHLVYKPVANASSFSPPTANLRPLA